MSRCVFLDMLNLCAHTYFLLSRANCAKNSAFISNYMAFMRLVDVHSFIHLNAFWLSSCFMCFTQTADLLVCLVFHVSAIPKKKKLITSCSFNPDLSDGKHIFSYHTLFFHCVVLFDFILAFYYVRKCPNSYIFCRKIMVLLSIFNACQQSALSHLNG